MSGHQSLNSGKKAVHVKWAGKTIALGTFPSGEADEKCARAKALTRAWRSTMRPKPSREWVMTELERLEVRVVSGRLGRREGEGSDDEGDGDSKGDAEDEKESKEGSPPPSSVPPHRPLVGGGSAAAYEAARADHYRNVAEQKGGPNKPGAGNMSARSNDIMRGQSNRPGGFVGDSVGGMGMGGPGSFGNDMMGLGGAGMMGSSNFGGGMQLGLSVNPNQHYEMLKLHHMNLLNEIQETTLMMNLYQQQQLQQQQRHIQQKHTGGSGGQSSGGSGGGLNGLDSSFPGGGALGSNESSLGRIGSPPLMGYGGGSGLGNPGNMPGGARQQNALGSMMGNMQGVMGSALGGNQQSLGGMNSRDEAAALEAKLQMLKQDIAEKERLAQGISLPNSSGQQNSDSSKRKPTKSQSSKDAKRSKGDKTE